LTKSTGVGKIILIADGTIKGIVRSIVKGIVTIEIVSDGKLGQKKNMCLPGCKINLPTITELDKIDIAEFGIKYQIDMIAVSFTRRGKDLIDLRNFLIQKDPVHGPNIHLISKI
jgi:pyruvate kinase